MPFNPAKIEDDLPSVTDWSDYDLSGGLSGTPVNGDSSVGVSSFSVAPEAGSVIRFKSTLGDYSDVYQTTSNTTSTFNIKPQIYEDNFLWSGATVEVLPHFDLTEWLDDVTEPDDEFDFDFGRQFLFPRGVTVTLSNVTDKIYNRLMHLVTRSALYSSGAFVATYAADGDYDALYCALSINANGIHKKIFAGKLVPEDCRINEKDKTIRLRYESVYAEAKNIKIKDVSEIYQGHWYTSSSYKTQTVSGKDVEIIAKMFREIGIRKRYFNVTNKEKTAGECILTLADVPYIEVGELIRVSGVATEFDGLHQVTAVDNISKLVYYEYGSDTVASASVSVTNGLAAWRVVFDPFEKLMEETIEGLTYTMADCWTIVPRWRKAEFEELSVWEHIKNYCVKFGAVASVDFYEGIAKGYFFSRNRTTNKGIILTQDHFVGGFEITPNWKNYDENGVEVTSEVTYYESDDGTYATLVNNRGNDDGSSTNYLAGGGNKGDEIEDFVVSQPVHDYKFQNHSQVYLGTAGGASTKYRPPLEKAVKSRMIAYRNTDKSVELRFPECFAVKLKMPVVYIAGDDLLRLASADGTVTGYTAATLGIVSDVRGVCGVPLIPFQKYDALPQYNEIPLSDAVFVADRDAGSDEVIHINGSISNTPRTTDLYSATEDLRHCSAGYVYHSEDDASPASGKIYLCVYVSTTATLGLSPQYYLRRLQLNMEDVGDSWETSDDGSSGYYKFTVTQQEKLNDGDIAFSTGDTIYGVFVHANILDPDFDDQLYFSDNDSGYSPTASRYLKSMPAFGDRTVSGVMTAGTPVGGDPRQLCWAPTSSGKALYWADQSGDRIYIAPQSTDWADVTNVVGAASGTPPTRGNSAGATSFTLPNPEGCWRLYDHALVCASNTDNKVYYVDLTTGTATCIADNATDGVSDPHQIYAVDFVQAWYDGSVYRDCVDVAADNYQPFFADQTRRQFNVTCKLNNSVINYTDIHLGDLIEIDSTVASQLGGLHTSCFVLRKKIDLYTHTITMTLLENAASVDYDDEPTAQPTALVFANVDDDQMDLSWTASVGGADGYLVLRKTGSAISDRPTDGAIYTAGETIGASVVAYVGSSTGFTQSGLTEETLYHYSVFAYNGSGGSINYRVIAPLTDSQWTFATEPTNQPTSLNIDNESGVTPSQGLTFTASAGGADFYLILRKSGGVPTGAPSDGTTYIAGDTIGDGTVVSVSSNVFAESTNLSGNTLYGYAVFAFNGATGRENYKTGSPLTGSKTTYYQEPSGSPTIIIGTRTTTTFETTITPSGTPDGFLVTYTAFEGDFDDVVRQMPSDGVEYSIGNLVGGTTYVGYRGASTSPTIILPDVDQKYVIVVHQYNGSGTLIAYSNLFGLDYDTTLETEPVSHPTSLVVSNPTSSTADVAVSPTVSGEQYLFAITQAGSPSGSPADGTSYSSGETFGDWTAKLTSATGSGTISGLAANTTYTVSCWPVAGTGGAQNYKTDGSPLSSSIYTLVSEPTNQATNLTGAWDGYTHIDLSWDASVGGADGYLLVRRELYHVDWTPTDGTSYSEGATYGSNVIVAVQAGTTKEDSTAWLVVDNYYAVFPFNGSGSSINYKTSGTVARVKVDAGDV